MPLETSATMPTYAGVRISERNDQWNKEALRLARYDLWQHYLERRRVTEQEHLTNEAMIQHGNLLQKAYYALKDLFA